MKNTIIRKTINEICEEYDISYKALMELFKNKERIISFVRRKEGLKINDSYYINHKTKMFEKI